MPERIATTHTLMEGTLVVYKRERSAIWQCRYKVDGMWQRASTKEKDLKQAKERAKELLIAAEIRKKENLPVITRRFKHCADLAIAQMDYELKVGTGKVIYETYKRVLEDYVVPVLGRRQINSITLADISALHQFIAEKMGRAPSRSTTVKHNAAINRVFDAAIARNFVTRAQLPELTAHGKESQVGPSFTMKEVQNLLAAFDDWINRARSDESRSKRELLRDYVDVLLDTGARPGKEILNLTWNKINYVIDPVAVKTGRYEEELENGLDAEEIVEHKLNRSVEMRVSGKTGARTLVGMFRSCKALARIAKRNHNVSDNFLRPFDALLKPNNNEFVFRYKVLNANGEVEFRRGKGFEHLFVAFLKEHNLLVDPKTNQSRKLYSLRHTYATLALTYDKVPIHTLAKQMGTSVLMIERHYSDLEPVRAIHQLRGEETRRLISAGGPIDEIYQSQQAVKAARRQRKKPQTASKPI